VASHNKYDVSHALQSRALTLGAQQPETFEALSELQYEAAWRVSQWTLDSQHARLLSVASASRFHASVHRALAAIAADDRVTCVDALRAARAATRRRLARVSLESSVHVDALVVRFQLANELECACAVRDAVRRAPLIAAVADDDDALLLLPPPPQQPVRASKRRRRDEAGATASSSQAVPPPPPPLVTAVTLPAHAFVPSAFSGDRDVQRVMAYSSMLDSWRATERTVARHSHAFDRLEPLMMARAVLLPLIGALAVS
jgi:hypothetical protein